MCYTIIILLITNYKMENRKAYVWNKHNLLVKGVASRDKTRPILESVYFKDNKSIACDGFRFIEITASNKKAEEYPIVAGKKPIGIKNTLLTLQDAEKIKLPKSKNVPIINEAFVFLEEKEKKVTLGMTDLSTSETKELTTLEGEYPDIDSIKPKDESDHVSIYVNAKFLKEMLAIVEQFTASNEEGKRTLEIKIKKDNATAPMIMKAKNDNTGQGLYGLLMPVRA